MTARNHPAAIAPIALYACALAATHGIHHAIGADYVIATSPKDAQRHALDAARHRWPQKDGWTKHTADVALIANECLQLVT